MYRQRIKKAWGHTAHRGWARLLLNSARDLITHGPAHRGANGAAMPTDEGDQDAQFFCNHPELGGGLPQGAVSKGGHKTDTTTATSGRTVFSAISQLDRYRPGSILVLRGPTGPRDHAAAMAHTV